LFGLSGGFFGNTDPASEIMQKKVHMLKDEGVVFDEHKAGRKEPVVKVSSSCVFSFEVA
jgi:predicted transcriptional regulator